MFGCCCCQYFCSTHTVLKNTTADTYSVEDCPGSHSVTASPSATTGESTLATLPNYQNCGACVAGGLLAPLTGVVNTFAACDGLASVVVTNGGTGYTDGDVLTITTAYPKTIEGVSQVAKFSVHAVAGVIQSATIIAAGVYAGIGANALAAQTTASGGTGTGAAFTFTGAAATYQPDCGRNGWQAAASQRQYHGTLGFTDLCGFSCPVGAANTPPAQKYLNIAWNTCVGQQLWYFQNWTALPVSFSGVTPVVNVPDKTAVYYSTVEAATADGTNGVNPDSGVIDYEVHVSTQKLNYGANPYKGPYTTPPTDNGCTKDGILVDPTGTPILDGSGNTLSATPPAGIMPYVGFPNCTNGPVPDASYDVDSWQVLNGVTVIASGSGQPSFDATNYFHYPPTGPYDAYQSGSLPLTSGSANCSNSISLVYTKISVTRTNDTYQWTKLVYTLENPGVYGTDESDATSTVWFSQSPVYSAGTVKLSGANTGASVLADAEANFAPWVLTNPNLMPLTTNAFDGIMAKVTRNEVPGDVSPVTYHPYWVAGSPTPVVYVDPNATFYDGTVKGLPNAAGGDWPLDYFDPKAITWVYESCDGGTTHQWDAVDFGEWRSAHPNLPAKATQWTDAIEAATLVIGRQRISGTVFYQEVNPRDGIFVTKYVESAVSNLTPFDDARPYGLDRNSISQNCLTCPTPDGTPACPGTAGTPAGCKVDCIRWQAVPPMGGRLAVISVVDNHDGTVTVTTAPMPVINTADTSGNANWGVYNVDLCDSAMTPLLTNIVPTASSTSVFTATATYATVAGAAWLCLYGGLATDTSPAPPTEVANWQRAHPASRGDYWIGEWSNSNGITPPLIATAYKKESTTPFLFILSPNASDDSGCGVRYDFSVAGKIDEWCGCEQWLDVVQAMTDPLWQKPVKCVGTTPTPDDSACVPLVEARFTLLPGAPTGGNFADYTVNLTTAGAPPPHGQPAPVIVPSGTFTPCP